MRADNRKSLERYRSQYEAWVNDDVLYDLDGSARNEILRIIREEWAPGYQVNVWCGKCVADMLVFAFKNMDNGNAI